MARDYVQNRSLKPFSYFQRGIDLLVAGILLSATIKSETPLVSDNVTNLSVTSHWPVDSPHPLHVHDVTVLWLEAAFGEIVAGIL